MRKMIAGVVAVVAILTVMVSGQALAQTPAAPSAPDDQSSGPQMDMTSDIELTRAAIQVRRQALVTAVMDLEPRESEVFWPLYRDYRAEMAKVNDRLVKLLVGYLDSYETLSDEAATKLVNEALSIERARNSVKTKFVPRFGKVLPARKVARFFQVDNKLDAVINADLAHLIPLAR